MIRPIVEDAVKVFLETHQKFWSEEDNQIIDSFNDEMFSDQNITKGTDIFSIILAILTEASTKFFKHKKVVPSAMWKIVLANIANSIFTELKADFNKKMSELSTAYPAPKPSILTEATNIIGELNDLKPIKELINLELGLEVNLETINYIKTSSREALVNILKLHSELDFTDTSYISSMEIIQTYKSLLSEAFDLVILLNQDLEFPKEVA